jgi:hypothetical protein
LLPTASRRALSQQSPAGTWTPPGSAAAPTPPDPIRALVLGVDRWLCRQSNMIYFSDDPDCILRVARNRADSDIVLSDGVAVARGDPILHLHFWNEQMPQTPAKPGLGWGGRFGRRLIRSFGELAVAMERDPRLSDAVAIRGRLAFAAARDSDDVRRFGHWFGLETPAEPGRLPLARRLHDAAEDVWLVALSYAFNPGSLRGRQMSRRRDDLWMSKDVLLARYGARRRAAA